MALINTLKNKLIDKIISSNNLSLLQQISDYFELNKVEEEVVLSSEYIKLLEMSDVDISGGLLVSEKELKDKDNKWMN